MKFDSFIFLLMLLIVSLALLVSSVHGGNGVPNSDHSPPETVHRRILHQPFFPVSSSPPPETDLLPPPPPDSSGAYEQDEPFFPEDPVGEGTQSQTPPMPVPPPPPPSTNGSVPISTAAQPTKPTKRAAIAISVGIVMLGMLSALLFYVFKCKAKHPVEEDRKQESGNHHSQSYGDGTRAPPSNFLYIGTVDPYEDDAGEAKGSPYQKLTCIQKPDRYRASPDLLPPPHMSRPPAASTVKRASQLRNSPTATGLSSSEDDSSRNSTRGESHGSGSGMPYSKRTSPRFRLPPTSPDVIKHAIIPSIKTTPPPQEAPLQPLPPENKKGHISEIKSSLPRVKFGAPPPPPNLALLKSISNHQSHHTPKVYASKSLQAPPPPPPPLPAQPVPEPPKVRSTWTNFIKRPSESAFDSQFLTPPSFEASSRQDVDIGCRSSGMLNGDDTDETKPKLKPLHWDKVRATSDRATAWDQLKPSSFQLNEDMMESLFGCKSNNSNQLVNNESSRKAVPHPAEQEKRVLDPKKSQNIAILLRALNVTRDEVSEALLDGNLEELGAELLETLLKMAPTKEEEIKLTGYKGDTSKLGSAEKFLKAVLDIPFAFRRVEAMLYRAHFDTEVKYLRKSYETLEDASSELMNSRLFLKLLQAVLTTGNRMNVGTSRGGAESFTLDTLLKLVDIKGTDGKTTLLHFVVQEIIRSEGIGSGSVTDSLGNQTASKGKEEEFRRQGLLVVAGLTREIGNVKLAAGMDSDVLHSNVSKLETGLQKVRTVLLYERSDMQGKFFESMKAFLSKAEEEICRIKEDERRALTHVREVTEYFHGEAAKKEAHPLRIFIIVRDFLSTLDRVSKDMGTMQDKTVTGTTGSFRISCNAPLPVISRYNVRQDYSSSEESSSP